MIHTRNPITSDLCGPQGSIVTAVAYLDAHYQLDPTGSNAQVAIPWVWSIRFSAELTYQSATEALRASIGVSHQPGGTHSFEVPSD